MLYASSSFSQSIPFTGVIGDLIQVLSAKDVEEAVEALQLDSQNGIMGPRSREDYQVPKSILAASEEVLSQVGSQIRVDMTEKEFRDLVTR